jgi:hypothetical protein
MHMMHLHIRNYKGVTKRNISSQKLLRANKSGINDEDDGGRLGKPNVVSGPDRPFLRPRELIYVEAIDEIIVERLVVEEIVADV